jgi:hypothetical protein
MHRFGLVAPVPNGFLLVHLISGANHRFKHKKRRQLFIRMYNETLSVIAVCVCNPDRSPVGIHG